MKIKSEIHGQGSQEAVWRILKIFHSYGYEEHYCFWINQDRTRHYCNEPGETI